MPVLRELSGGREYPLQGAALIVGRAAACDIQFLEAKVSARHARIEKAGESWFVTDLGSSNGTFVNGDHIHERTRLRPGDQIDFSGPVLAFIDGPETIFTLKEAAPGIDQPPVLKSLEVTDEIRTQVSPEAKLRAVLEISRNLGTTLDLAEVLPKILESLF